MLHITIISVGKLKEDYWKSAEAEYLKRLKPYTKIEIKELKEEKFDEKSNAEIIKQKEAEKIKATMPKGTHIIALDKNGTQYSSSNFSRHFATLAMNQCNNITIIIGGPLGLHSSVLNLANEKISFSKSTFTHQMTRVILLEQLYRSYMIKEGRTYHY